MVPNLARLVKAARAAERRGRARHVRAPPRRQGDEPQRPAVRRRRQVAGEVPARQRRRPRDPRDRGLAHRHRPHPHARAEPDVGHRPRRGAAQPRRDHHRRHRRVGERRRHQPGHGGGEPGLRRRAAPRRGVRGARRLRRRGHREHPAACWPPSPRSTSWSGCGRPTGEVLPVPHVRRPRPVARPRAGGRGGGLRPDLAVRPRLLPRQARFVVPVHRVGAAALRTRDAVARRLGHDRRTGRRHRADPVLDPRLRPARSATRSWWRRPSAPRPGCRATGCCWAWARAGCARSSSNSSSPSSGAAPAWRSRSRSCGRCGRAAWSSTTASSTTSTGSRWRPSRAGPCPS